MVTTIPTVKAKVEQVKTLGTEVCNLIVAHDPKNKSLQKSADSLSKAMGNILLIENAISTNSKDLPDQDKVAALNGVYKSLASAKKNFQDLFSSKKDRVILNTAVEMQVKLTIDEVNQVAGVKSGQHK